VRPILSCGSHSHEGGISPLDAGVSGLPALHQYLSQPLDSNIRGAPCRTDRFHFALFPAGKEQKKTARLHPMGIRILIPIATSGGSGDRPNGTESNRTHVLRQEFHPRISTVSGTTLSPSGRSPIATESVRFLQERRSFFGRLFVFAKPPCRIRTSWYG
jgi:hypothetical protein